MAARPRRQGLSAAPTAASSQALGLARAKLATSGLTLADAKALKIDVLGPAQTGGLSASFKALCALRFNYLGPDGKPLIDWPQGKPFYRLRYLERGAGFEAQAAKEVRYVQPAGTAPVAYYPQGEAWDAIVKDPDRPLLITEGELKAAAACRAGFPTIGLGGVWSFRSHKLGLEWLPSLDLVAWPRRYVYVAFDSDYRTNPLVLQALAALAQALHDRGAVVHVLSLPAIEGLEKVGLDDLLVREGPNGPARLKGLLHASEPLGLTKPLWQLNDRYVYVRQPGLLVDQRSGAKSSPSAFKDHLESTSSYQERTMKKDGSLSYEKVAASAAWLRWPLRKEAEKLTYAPGKPRLFEEREQPCWNLWPGWGLEPKKGDVAPFKKLIDHLFLGAEPEAKRWFLRWCAYPLIYPGTKLFSSIVIHGIRHGTGKSFIGYTLGKIYGKNFTEIKQQDLHGAFNEWAEGKQLVLADDVTGSDKRQDADLLKKLITQKELRVNAKYLPSYTVPDHVNYIFTSNSPDSFFLDDDDRRFFIHEVKVGPLSEEFYADYELWLASGGAAAIFDYLLKLDLGNFNPAAPAFRTAAKERMIVRGQSDLGGWVRELLAVPDQVLRFGEVKMTKDLFTSKELLRLYDPASQSKTTANGLARELARAGFDQVCHGRPVRGLEGQARYFIIRNRDQWVDATPAAVLKHLQVQATKGGGRGGD